MIVSPWEFFPEYEAVIDAVELESIRKNSVHEADLEVYLIVTIGKNFNQSTANLIAPIVINAADGVGKQFVLHDSKYGTKHLLIPEGSGE
jgi:flagellar assembly factor FliW